MPDAFSRGRQRRRKGGGETALTPGARLGPYEIRGRIGAGGMGEVYRAFDPRLQRDVAIKVLLPEAAADHDRVRRFEAEARAAGALGHPNVLAVYDVGRGGGTPYLRRELGEFGVRAVVPAVPGEQHPRVRASAAALIEVPERPPDRVPQAVVKWT